jgi:ArsR family transcriptional regulator
MAVSAEPAVVHALAVGARPAAAADDGSLQAVTLSFDQAQCLLRALNEPIRLQVVQALQHGERCVCDLTSDLDLAQSKLSFHLKVLKEAGLIHARQEGRWIYYRLDPSALLQLRDWLHQLAAACQSPATPCS